MPRYVVYRSGPSKEEIKKDLLRTNPKATEIEITIHKKKKSRNPGWKYYRISFLHPKIGGSRRK